MTTTQLTGTGLRSCRGTGLLLCAVLLAGNAAADIVNLNPDKDNTIYEGSQGGNPPDNFEDNSCGAGDYLFSGLTNDNFARRALLKFDIAGSVPAGATINSVVLTLQVNRERDGSGRTYTIHPVLKDWGEGMVDCDSVAGGHCSLLLCRW
jgi:hypothetical protein